jgi:adenylosuccinate lyase
MNLLDWLFVDKTMDGIWSETQTINYWLRVEAELAGALSDAKVITEPEADAISKACVFESIDVSELVASGK